MSLEYLTNFDTDMSDSKEDKKKAVVGEEEDEEEKETKEGEGSGEEEEEEFLPEGEKKKRDSASAKKGKESGSGEGNAEYDDKMEADRCKRFEFLLKQTEIFGHFMQEAGEGF